MNIPEIDRSNTIEICGGFRPERLELERIQSETDQYSFDGVH